jgi:hypothetical protein
MEELTRHLDEDWVHDQQMREEVEAIAHEEFRRQEEQLLEWEFKNTPAPNHMEQFEPEEDEAQGVLCLLQKSKYEESVCKFVTAHAFDFYSIGESQACSSSAKRGLQQP